MKILLRSLIALSAIAVLWPGTPSVATAAINGGFDAARTTELDGIGFLDLKTFLIGPGAGEDPALASERIRIISPETLLYEGARTGMHDPLMDYGGLLSSVQSKTAPLSDTGIDSLTIEVNGAPVTLSLGLRDALVRDLKENIRQHGIPGLFGASPGILSAGFLGKAVDDVTRRIDALERLVRGETPRHDTTAFLGTREAFVEPSSLPIFAAGLLAIAWLRRSRLFPGRRKGA